MALAGVGDVRGDDSPPGAWLSTVGVFYFSRNPSAAWWCGKPVPPACRTRWTSAMIRAIVPMPTRRRASGGRRNSMDPLTERLLAQDADTAANGPYQAQVLCAYPDCNRTRRPVNIPRSDYELALRRHKPDMVRGRT